MVMWKLLINKYLKQLINGVIAGLLIGLACVCSLYLQGINQVVLGGLIFGLGFLFVALYGFEYYTSKVGYLVENKAIYILDLVLALLGNFIGAWLIALVVKMTSLSEASNPFMIGLNQVLLSRSGEGLVFDLFGKSLLSGLVVYFAFNTYKKAEQPIARFVSLFIAGVVVSIVGLDELVSDMFYFNMGCLSGYHYGDLITKLGYVLIGNSLGALIIPCLRKLKGLLKSQ